MAVFKQSNKKFKYNFIDFIFLTVILTLIAVGIWAIVSKSPQVTDTQHVTFTIEIHNVDNEVAGNLAVGDIISSINTKTVLGTVEAVKVKPESIECLVSKTVETIGESGELEVTEQKSVELADSLLYSTVTITCKAQADIDGSGITVNGGRILAGETLGVYSRTFAGEGVITSIYKAGEVK